MDSSSFSFEAGARSTHARCRYQNAPSSPMVTDIRRSPISASIRRCHSAWSGREIVVNGTRR